MTKDARPWARFAARPQGPQSRTRWLGPWRRTNAARGCRRAAGRASETIAAAHLLVARREAGDLENLARRASLTLLGTFIRAGFHAQVHLRQCGYR